MRRLWTGLHAVPLPRSPQFQQSRAQDYKGPSCSKLLLASSALLFTNLKATCLSSGFCEQITGISFEVKNTILLTLCRENSFALKLKKKVTCMILLALSFLL